MTYCRAVATGMVQGGADRMARPSLRAVVTNFREYDADILTKVRLSVANTLTKVRTRSSCCGHPGQPGC
jgi:hypothetical protein